MKKILFILSGFLLATSAFAQFEYNVVSFKDLYNKYRVAQPKIIPWSANFWPYASDGTAVKLDAQGEVDSKGESPMEVYGKVMGIGLEAQKWEKENHSCDGYDKATKASCEGWWGHCNGWTAAAIKEVEPRETVRVNGVELSVAEQKGILTELWLASYSLNVGETDKATKMGAWVHKHNDPNPSDAYKSFWDIDPTTFFMILTNYVGAMKTGIAIDQFTGDQVWNQPLVGYRLLPIKAKDITKNGTDNKAYWSVKMGVKFFWANDLGTPFGHIGQPFDIFKMTSDAAKVEKLSDDYEGRYLEFTMNFDDEVVVSSDGKTIVKAGEIVGEGFWEHQKNSKKYTYEQLNYSHPDFIWLPTNPYQDTTNGYGNPHLDVKISKLINKARVSGARSITASASTPTQAKQEVTVVFQSGIFRHGANGSTAHIANIVNSIMQRDSLKASVQTGTVTLENSQASMKITFASEFNMEQFKALFEAAGRPIANIK